MIITLPAFQYSQYAMATSIITPNSTTIIFYSLNLYSLNRFGTFSRTVVKARYTLPVFTGHVHGPSKFQNDAPRAVDTGTVCRAPVFTGRVGKKHCYAMLFANLPTRPVNTRARGHGP